jgi:hypothetical protein
MTKEIVICPYDKARAKLVDGSAIYPHRIDLHSKRFYLCEVCGAYVGCHEGTNRALGRLANAELRRWKSKAHASFDPLWKTRKWGTRKQAYTRLASELGVAENGCHIGMFDVEQCKKVISIVSQE